MKDKQILYSSTEAAKFKTGIDGWISSDGRFFGNDENLARYQGCTHISCKDCGAPIPVRSYTACDDCRHKKQVERFHAMPKLDWDEKTPLYSDSDDLYFFDSDQLTEYMIDNGRTTDSLRLIICRANNFCEISEDGFHDDLPEDCYDIPEELQVAIKSLNNVINKLPPASWSPGKFAATIKINVEHKNETK